MSNLFSMETPLWQWFTKAAMVVWMNFLWLICCIPVITIGASTAAYYRMLFNVREDKPVSFRKFFLAFASNFRQATALWLIQAGLVIVIYLLGWYTFAVASNLVRVALLLLFLAALAAFTLMLVYSIPLTCYFYNTLSGTIRNSLAMGIRHYHQTIPAIVLLMLPLAVMTLLPYLFLRWLPIVITLGISGLNYCIMLLLEKVFHNYTEEN